VITSAKFSPLSETNPHRKRVSIQRREFAPPDGSFGIWIKLPQTKNLLDHRKPKTVSGIRAEKGIAKRLPTFLPSNQPPSDDPSLVLN
jgi:hypothetical protein